MNLFGTKQVKHPILHCSLTLSLSLVVVVAAAAVVVVLEEFVSTQKSHYTHTESVRHEPTRTTLVVHLCH